MKKIIYSKFDKSVIPSLPRVTFPGEIVTINSEPEADRAVEQLLQQEMQGVAELSVPLLAEAHAGHNWLAAKG